MRDGFTDRCAKFLNLIELWIGLRSLARRLRREWIEAARNQIAMLPPAVPAVQQRDDIEAVLKEISRFEKQCREMLKSDRPGAAPRKKVPG